MPQVHCFIEEEQYMAGRVGMLLAGITVCGLLAGCGAESTAPEEGSAPEELIWQQAYTDYLDAASAEGDAGEYVMIYVDDDDTPELARVGDNETEGSTIISFDSQKIQETQLSGRYFTYLEKEGLICSSGGKEDCYWDLVYQLEDGQAEELAAGYYGLWQYYEEDKEIEFNEENLPVYLYEWNKEKVTEEAYTENLYGLYDLERALPGFSDEEEGYTAEEMKDILKNWQG